MTSSWYAVWYDNYLTVWTHLKKEKRIGKMSNTEGRHACDRYWNCLLCNISVENYVGREVSHLIVYITITYIEELNLLSYLHFRHFLYVENVRCICIVFSEATLREATQAPVRWCVTTCSPSLPGAPATTAWCLCSTNNTNALTSQTTRKNCPG